MGRVTTHVLDTAQGKPGAAIPIRLYQIHGEQRHFLKELVTNSDGRTDAPVLDETEYASGVWELVFQTAEYFSKQGVSLAEPPFLNEIPIRFSTSSDQHYHVPLLVSPWSYSTYRGS